jgi:hypothetical protein
MPREIIACGLLTSFPVETICLFTGDNSNFGDNPIILRFIFYLQVNESVNLILDKKSSTKTELLALQCRVL